MSDTVQSDWCLSSKKRKLGHRPAQRTSTREHKELPAMPKEQTF